MDPVILKTPGGNTATLYCGDQMEVLRNLYRPRFPAIEICAELCADPPKIDVVLTDPPYEIPTMGGGGCFGDRELYHDMEGKGADLAAISDGIDIPECLGLWKRIGAPVVMCFCSQYQVAELWVEMRKIDYAATILTWQKTNPIPFCENTWLPDMEYVLYGRQPGSYMNNDVPFDLKRRGKQSLRETERHWHPTPKPTKILQEYLAVICPEGGTVLDPFLGSGSTAIAALKMKMNFIGIELNPDHFEKAVREIKREACQKKMSGF